MSCPVYRCSQAAADHRCARLASQRRCALAGSRLNLVLVKSPSDHIMVSAAEQGQQHHPLPVGEGPGSATGCPVAPPLKIGNFRDARPAGGGAYWAPQRACPSPRAAGPLVRGERGHGKTTTGQDSAHMGGGPGAPWHARCERQHTRGKAGRTSSQARQIGLICASQLISAEGGAAAPNGGYSLVTGTNGDHLG
jgi:hypothetical protein